MSPRLIKGVTATASGRVNLIGEHTDYNLGYVLPVAIPQTTRVTLRARSDHRIAAVSSQLSDAGRVSYVLGEEAPSPSWSTYLQGITWLLVSAGHTISGFEARIESNVPMNSGLSSSSALTVSMLRALRELFSLKLDEIEIAQLCQQVENRFAGAHLGMMDPMACSLCAPAEALFLDTRDLSYRAIPIPPSIELIVISSGALQCGATSGYNTRRSECEEASARLRVANLRELNRKDLPRLRILPDLLARRVRHVITENERVNKAVIALETDNPKELGALCRNSHLSLRDDYEVSTPELDLLVELACSTPGVYGARLTGGGFGGSIVAIARRGQAISAAEQIVSRYIEACGCEASILVPQDPE